MTFISHSIAQVWIDPGSTPFVNPNFMSSLDIKVERLPYELEISTPFSEFMFLID